MTDAPTNVINMQAKARLIREAQEAREKRRAERAEHVNGYPTAADDAWNPKVPYPGGIDDMEV